MSSRKESEVKTNSFTAEAQRTRRTAERFLVLSAPLCVLCVSAVNEFQVEQLK